MPPTTSASRSRARRRATSTPRSSHCRPTGGGPCARYMRLPAASTTRRRAICATRRSCGCSPTRVPASLGTARHGRSTRCWWRSAMSTDGFGYRSPVSMISSTGPRVTCTRPPTTRSRTSSTTAARSRARSGGCRSPFWAAATRRPRPSWPTTSASRCSSPTPCATALQDFQRGRVYLPREDFELFGCPADPLSAAPEPLARMIRHQARRNREWYDRGLALLPLLDARGAAYVEALAGTHTRLLERIERSPTDVLRGRISLPAPERVRIAATALTAKAGQSHAA